MLNYADGKEPNPALLQKWNADRSFTKAFLDSEGDPVLEMDVLFTVRRIAGNGSRNAFGFFNDSLAGLGEQIGWDEPDGDDGGKAPVASH